MLRHRYPAAIAAVRELAAAGFRLLVLSNSSRVSTLTLDRLEKLGYDSGCFAGAVTSGDCTHELLLRNAATGELGRKCWHLTWDARGTLGVDLDALGLEFVETAAEADFVLLHGTEAVTFGGGLRPISAAEVRAQLTAAGDKPCVCANPDYVTVKGEELVTMPGTFARFFEDECGASDVRWMVSARRRVGAGTETDPASRASRPPSSTRRRWHCWARGRRRRSGWGTRWSTTSGGQRRRGCHQYS